MIREKRINEVMDKFFTALKDQEDYKIESTGLTYFMTLELIKAACEESIKKNPDKFENLCSWFVSAAMYLLNDIDELEQIDLQIRNAQ